MACFLILTAGKIGNATTAGAQEDTGMMIGSDAPWL